MNLIMKNVTFKNIADIKNFLFGNEKRNFELSGVEDRYAFIRETLVSVNYLNLKKKDRGEVKKCLQKITGYEDRQMKRLIKKWKVNGLPYRKPKTKGAAVSKYKPEDIALLIKTDIAHLTPNGNAAQAILRRELLTFGKEEYETIAGVSVSHIYNLRNHKKQYLSSEAVRYSKTIPVSTNIGERRKPSPLGIPGYLRVDSVHQGDFGGEKGVYHINIVDEVTQWEIVGCVEKISDEFMIPLLEKMIEQFPFVIHNFHSDNGSEYINKMVAKVLGRLLIDQTKSRSRHSNDNALVEGKNGSVIRKHMGRNHIPQKNAPFINEYYEKYFNLYLPFHRISAFATDYTDKRGKVRKKYETYITPYQKLKSLPNAEQYLKENISFEFMDKIAYAQSDNEFAENMEKVKKEMIKKIKR
jgi:transposase InsO family protein